MANRNGKYGKEHRKVRKAKLPYAIGETCAYCGRVMRDGEALDLDHSLPLALGGSGAGDRMVHASCNRAAGNRIRAELMRRARVVRSSRQW
jgi:5-methylcytosine-specific restriction endonuclease McrA